MYVRAFAKIYNPTMAIEVLKELKNTYPNATLCMVGPDKDGTQADVQQLIKRYQLHDSVEITGVLSKEDWHKKSEDFDIFINTTNVDNTPVSVIEAMALGLPVVSTNAGGVPYLLSSKKNALLVDPNCVEKMSKYIIDLVQGSYPHIADNARDLVEKFDWTHVKSNWIKILR